jgi:hypothetical protein
MCVSKAHIIDQAESMLCNEASLSAGMVDVRRC